MQIILLEKVVNVGDLGDVVKVKQGYARNYLLPHGKAKRATAENIAAIEATRGVLEKAASAKLEAAQAQAAKLEGLTLQITQKAGVDGRLFGSVTNADIVEALKPHGFDLEKAAVHMPAGPLKQVGDYPLVVSLHPDANANVTVSVIGETPTA